MSTNTLSLNQATNKSFATSKKALLLKALPAMLINTIAPFVVYNIASSHMSTVNALLLASGAPLIMSVVELIRKRHIDVMALLIVLGFVLSAAAAFLFNSPTLLLLQSTIVSALFGLIFLASLLLSRPLLFYVIRSMTCHTDQQRIANFNADWEFAQARFFYRAMTGFWGCLMIAHLGIQIVLVLTLPVASVLAIGSILNLVIILCGAGWSMYYTRKNRFILQQLKQQRDQGL
ncbi:VC0807 family protein [Dictyobacter formicarum]|uniref:Intracellular septation protein A n=1 Tax=Dictyobacter formicarum TaxID=2778368 RepID=A0ABQ3VKT1_9CHLR|nr:VC0807 family protein [Dictyobacter formicarum]GHO86299.1 hypothetical protein KSZ_43050 [Dictyobacter formicarum]